MKSTSTEFRQAFENDDTVYAAHKVICEFGSNRFNEGQIVTASSTKTSQRGTNIYQKEDVNFWRAEDVFNNKNRNSMKWLVCDSGATVSARADGTGYRTIHLDSNIELEHGWWSEESSEYDGVFRNPQWVQSTFTPRLINNITLYLTEGYPNMKWVTVEYQDESGDWVSPEDMNQASLGESEYKVSWDIELTLIQGLRVTVHATHMPYDVARVSELQGYLIEDISDDVVSFDVEDTRENYEDSTVPIGTHSANTFTLTLDNTEGRYNKDGGDIHAPFLGPGLRFEPYLGVDLNKGKGSPNYEFVPMGEFWADEMETDSSGMTARVSCRDFSKFLQDDVDSGGFVWRDSDMVKISRDVLALLGKVSEDLPTPPAIYDALGAREPYWKDTNPEASTVSPHQWLPGNFITDSSGAGIKVMRADGTADDWWTMGNGLYTATVVGPVSGGWFYLVNSTRDGIARVGTPDSAFAWANLLGTNNRPLGNIFLDPEGGVWATSAESSTVSEKYLYKFVNGAMTRRYRLTGGVYGELHAIAFGKPGEIYFTTSSGVYKSRVSYEGIRSSGGEGPYDYDLPCTNLYTSSGSGLIGVAYYEGRVLFGDHQNGIIYSIDADGLDEKVATVEYDASTDSETFDMNPYHLTVHEDHLYVASPISQGGDVGGAVYRFKLQISGDGLRDFDFIYIKDQSYWQFLEEVAFADQGVFGFDSYGNFYYHSYNSLNEPPYNSSVYNFSYDTNIEDGTFATKLYLNKAVVTVNPLEEREEKLSGIWSPPDNDILQWSSLGANISATAKTIPVRAARNQKTSNLTSNFWHEEDGILFIPEWEPTSTADQRLSGDPSQFLLGGELIKYKSRTDGAFTECIRGYLGTTPKAWPAGRHIGEARYYEMEFSNAPASQVRWPYVTAIDTLQHSDEKTAQAEVVFFEHDSFGGKLCIANLVPWMTWLEGTGTTYKDHVNPETQYELNFNTAVAGVVVVEKAGKEKINKEAEDDIASAENKEYIRRYGINKIDIDNPWIQTKRHAEQMVKIFIDEYGVPRDVIELNVVANPALQTGDRVTITHFPHLDIENRDYHVISASYAYNGGLRGTVTLRQVRQ